MHGLLSNYQSLAIVPKEVNTTPYCTVFSLNSIVLEVLTIIAYTGRPRPKGVGISQVEVYKRVGKSVI